MTPIRSNSTRRGLTATHGMRGLLSTQTVSANIGETLPIVAKALGTDGGHAALLASP